MSWFFLVGFVGLSICGIILNMSFRKAMAESNKTIAYLMREHKKTVDDMDAYIRRMFWSIKDLVDHTLVLLEELTGDVAHVDTDYNVYEIVKHINISHDEVLDFRNRWKQTFTVYKDLRSEGEFGKISRSLSEAVQESRDSDNKTKEELYAETLTPYSYVEIIEDLIYGLPYAEAISNAEKRWVRNIENNTLKKQNELRRLS